MGTIPTPPTFTAGQVLTASQCNQLVTCLNFWASPPRALLYNNAAQSVPNNTLTLITHNSETYDTDGMHDTVTNNSRLYARTAGYYAISAALSFVTNGTGTRGLQIRLNAAGSSSGGTLIYDLTFPAVSGAQSTVVLPQFTYPMALDDYIELFGNQSSGGALNTSSGANNTFMQMQLAGKV